MLTSVKNTDPPVYNNVDIKKYECCGHVQKRTGKHFMNKVAELKQKTFMHNGKIVKGIWNKKGGLSSRVIKKIQGHYGAAICSNVSKMKRDNRAIWKHRARKHDDCSSWCPSKQNPPGDPNKNALHPHVSGAIKPVFVID